MHDLSVSLWDLRTIPLWSKWTKDLTLYCLNKTKEIMILWLQNFRKPIRPEMCSERDSPLKRLYRRTHAKLTSLAGSRQLVWAAGCELSLALVHACVTGRDIWDNTSGSPAAQNAAARSHTSDLTRGRFCFRVSTGGPRWAPQMSRANSGWPGAGKTKGTRGLSLSLHISDKTDYLVNRHNMMGTVSKLYVSNNTWIYVYIKNLTKSQIQFQLPRVSTPIPTPTPGVSTPTPTPASLLNINSNSNSNSGSFNSNSGKSLEYQLQLQLRRFQLQFQLRSWPQPCQWWLVYWYMRHPASMS